MLALQEVRQKCHFILLPVLLVLPPFGNCLSVLSPFLARRHRHAAFSSRYPPPTRCRNYSSSPTSCARFVSLAAKRLLPRVFVDPADRPLVCLCLHPPPPTTTTLLLLLAALPRASRNSVRKLTWKERVRSRLLLFFFLSFSAPPAHLPYPLLLPMILAAVSPPAQFPR